MQFTATTIMAIATALIGFTHAQDEVNTFYLMSIRSASPIHYETINASDTRFWIGKSTTTYCPLDPSECPPGNETWLTGSSGNDSYLSMSTVVPGGQRVYIGPAGALRFTQAHSSYEPKGSKEGGFSITPWDSNPDVWIIDHKGGFYACPAKKENVWQIFVGVKGFHDKNGDCLSFTMFAPGQDGVAAWQYT